MASTVNRANEHAAFLAGCVNKTRSIRDVCEALGIYSETLDPRKNNELYPPEANELYAKIKNIAKSFIASPRGDSAQLQVDLAKETAFSGEISTLASRYGESIWTKKYGSPENLDWSRSADRDTIQFYLRCWIVSVVMKFTSTSPRRSPRKSNGKDRLHRPGGRETEPTIMSDSNLTPNKRKAVDVDEPSSQEKVNKVPKKSQPRAIPVQEPQSDVDSVFGSPTTCLGAQTSSSSETQEHSDNTQDIDSTQRHRNGIVEMETPGDSDEVSQTDIHGNPPGTTASRRSTEDATVRQATAGPSGTYVTPSRRESVIRNDIQTAMDSASVSEPVEDVHAASRAPNASGLSKREQREVLFKVLLCHLNDVEHFSVGTEDTEAEEQMDKLLLFLQTDDKEQLQARLGEDFSRLDKALSTWVHIRLNLDNFRTRTAYFGEPGDDWQAYLSRMSNAPCALASLEYVNFQDRVRKNGDLVFVTSTFDDDLMRVFDALTTIKGCNGKEAFKGVRQYNAALLEWFKEDVA